MSFAKTLFVSQCRGNKERTLKIFNYDSNKIIKNVDIGNKVCAVLWNKKKRNY